MSNPHSPKNVVFRAALSTAPAWPVADRIALYRGLAEYSGDQIETQRLLRLAADLELAEQRHAELSLSFTPNPKPNSK